MLLWSAKPALDNIYDLIFLGLCIKIFGRAKVHWAENDGKRTGGGHIMSSIFTHKKGNIMTRYRAY